MHNLQISYTHASKYTQPLTQIDSMETILKCGHGLPYKNSWWCIPSFMLFHRNFVYFLFLFVSERGNGSFEDILNSNSKILKPPRGLQVSSHFYITLSQLVLKAFIVLLLFVSTLLDWRYKTWRYRTCVWVPVEAVWGAWHEHVFFFNVIAVLQHDRLVASYTDLETWIMTFNAIVQLKSTKTFGSELT